MSYSIDVNILLYASDETAPAHVRSVEFLNRCAASPEILYLAWTCLMSYLRIGTHQAIFTQPLTPAEAMANVSALISLPQVRTIGEQEGFWNCYQDITRGLVVRGNLVPDAHFAALLFQNGITTLYTHDADFRRFEFLSVRNPLLE